MAAIVDVTKYPYYVKADGITDGSAAVQQAIDNASSLVTKNGAPHVVVYLPASEKPYVISKPVFVMSDDISIRGDGYGTKIVTGSHDCFVFAWNEKMVGVRRWDGVYRPDLFGKLDSSVAPSAGKAWGFYTNKKAWMQLQGHPLQLGPRDPDSGLRDYWQKTRKLTLETCYEPVDDSFYTVCGIGVNNGNLRCSPFILCCDNVRKNHLTFYFRTADQPDDYNIDHAITFSLEGAKPPYHVCVQIDLTAGTYQVYLNRKQVTATLSRPFKDTVLRTNDCYPFIIGSVCDMSGPMNNPNGISNIKVYGLRLSSTLRYQDIGANAPQTRVDEPGVVVNDAYSYLSVDSESIGSLNVRVAPDPKRPYFVAMGGDLPGTGYWIPADSLTWQISNNKIENLYIAHPNVFGSCVVICNVNELDIDRCKLMGGARGVSNLNVIANYNVYLRRCHISGYDTAYYGFSQILHATDTYIQNSGRHTVRMVGCNSNWRNTMIAFPNPPTTRSFFRFVSYMYGGMHSIVNTTIDNESGEVHPEGAVIDADAHPYGSTTLIVDNLYVASGGSVPIFRLRDLAIAPGVLPSMIDARCIVVAGNYSFVVETDGPNWFGSVDVRRLPNAAMKGPAELGIKFFNG